MSGVTWSKFFWSDWRSDPAVRLCSLSARGLWIDMLSFMAEADGYLLVGGKSPTVATLSRMIGTDVADVQAAMNELEEHGVFSRTGKGVIYCRRIVRAAKKAETARKNLKTGHGARGGKDEENSALPPNAPGRHQKPEPEPEAATPSATQLPRTDDAWPTVPPNRMLEVFALAVGSSRLDPSKNVSPKFHAEAPGYLRRWRDAGCSWLEDVLPVATARAAAADGPIQTLKYFDAAILQAHASRTAPIPATGGTHHDDKLTRRHDNYRRALDGARALAQCQSDSGGGGLGGD